MGKGESMCSQRCPSNGRLNQLQFAFGKRSGYGVHWPEPPGTRQLMIQILLKQAASCHPANGMFSSAKLARDVIRLMGGS